MVGPALHHLGKWLAGTLEPILKLYSKHRIYDLYTFAQMIQNMSDNPPSFSHLTSQTYIFMVH